MSMSVSLGTFIRTFIVLVIAASHRRALEQDAPRVFPKFSVLLFRRLISPACRDGPDRSLDEIVQLSLAANPQPVYVAYTYVA